MIELRSLIKGEIFDYQMLMYCLRDYQKPRDKVTKLLKNGSIIRLKKGIYAFGLPFRKGLLSQEIVAAILVQPSYISKEYALHHYGLLPERVERVTSMTTRKKKYFATPVGQFDYFSITKKKFSLGVEAKEVPGEGGYLLATKEKALADWMASIPQIFDEEAFHFFIYQESRIDQTSLFPLNRRLLEEICIVYRNRNVDFLLKL